MPIKIPDQLPAKEILESENIFVMGELRAIHQDIRPLRIAILNLMPTKIATETQLLRLLGNSPIQIEIVLLRTATHQSRNTSEEHLAMFYATFDEVREQKFDGLIITGAPVETLDFEQVDYWPELQAIMDWSRRNVWATLFVCWGAQAGLYHFYGIPKYPLAAKMFGVFPHRVNIPLCAAVPRLRRRVLRAALAPHREFAAPTWKRSPSWIFCPSQTNPGFTSSPPKTVARCSSPGIPSTTR